MLKTIETIVAPYESSTGSYFLEKEIKERVEWVLLEHVAKGDIDMIRVNIEQIIKEI